MKVRSSQLNRIPLCIFFILFLGYSYFFQGGGWNQNSRFDQIRSIVEAQQFEINEYLVYQATAGDAGITKLQRLALSTGGKLGEIVPFGNTGDISLFNGKIYPNKPPGSVFVALPAYFAVYSIEKHIGLDADDWWLLTVNSYLTTVFSVGFLTALGGVVFYLVSLRLFPSMPPWAHVVSTMTYGFGTLMFPFATILFDHDLVATFSLTVFWLLLTERQGGFSSVRPPIIFLWRGCCRD